MRTLARFSAFVLLLVCAGPAHALTIVSDDATLVQLAGPQDFSLGGPLQSNTEVYLFEEQSNLTLAADLTVDAAGPGTYTSAGPASVIAAGTAIRSFFFHVDVLATETHGGGGRTVGTVVFDQPILGIIGVSASLDATDARLGDPASTYTPPPQARGTWEASDSLTLRPDGRTLVIDSLRVSSARPYADQFRIITAAPAVAVPEAGLPLLMLSLAAGRLGLRRAQR